MTQTSLGSKFRSIFLLAGDLNAKNPVRNSWVTNLSGMRLLDLQDNSDFQMSAPRCPTQCTPQGNGDILMHQNVRLSDVTRLGSSADPVPHPGSR
jgi:hypothetical protein